MRLETAIAAVQGCFRLRAMRAGIISKAPQTAYPHRSTHITRSAQNLLKSSSIGSR